MDAGDFIRQDHERVSSLFLEYERAVDPKTRARVVQDALHELRQHAQMGEEVLNPEIRKLLGEDRAQQNLDGMDVLRGAIQRVEALSPASEEFDPTVQELMAGVSEHVRLEEDEELPELRERLTSSALEELGKQMAEFKARMVS